MQVNNNKEYKNFSKIVNTFYNEEIENISEEEIDIKSKGTIKLEPKIIYDKFTGNMKIEFQTGEKKMLNNAKQNLVSELVLAEHANQDEVEEQIENRINTSLMTFRAEGIEQESIVNKLKPFNGTDSNGVNV